MKPKTARLAAGALAIVAVAAVLSFVLVQPLFRFAIVEGAASIARLHLSFGSLNVGIDRLAATNVHVQNAAGEPIADIGTFRLRYSLADLLPGGKRMYGIVAFDVERAHLVVIRHRDGSFNIPVPKNLTTSKAASAPYRFDGRLRDVSVDVYDAAQGVPAARHLRISNVEGDFSIATDARSRYRVAITYAENGRAFPIAGNGDVDVAAGLGLQRWRASQLPIARIADFALNSPSFHVAGGSLHDLDVRVAGLADGRGSLQQHVSATATIDRARIAIGGLAKPLRDVNGAIAVYGDGMLLQNVDATIANVPIHLGGGVFNLRAPSFRLTVSGGGDLRDLRTVLAQSTSLPLSGNAQLDVAVEGRASKPLTLIALSVPQLRYKTLAFDAAGGRIAFDGQEVDVLDLHAGYGQISLGAAGRLNLHPKRNGVEVVVRADAPPDALPYVDAIVPHMPLHASVLAMGDRLNRVAARGILFGRTLDTRLAAALNASSDGTASIGPLRIDGPKQSLYALASLDRPHDRFDAYLEANEMRVGGGSAAGLPGLRLPALPPFSATVNGRIVGSLIRGRTRVAGDLRVSNVTTPYADVARANVRFGQSATSELTMALNAGGIGALGAAAEALVSYDRGVVHVRNAAAASRGTFADAQGAITGIAAGDPHYDLHANVHSVDVAALAALAQPKTAGLIEGTADARVRISGAGRSPSVAGTLQLPEGAVNGLAFHQLDASFGGSATSLWVRNGGVTVGSTRVAFAGGGGRSAQRINLSAPHARLEDFNDFFDAGDMLGGEGSLRAAAARSGNAIVATRGDIELRNAKVRSFELGTATAHWYGTGKRIDTSLAFGGDSGHVLAAGTIALDGGINLRARARGVDLARWLPMAGVVLPVTGIARSDIAVSGRYPDVDSTVTAEVAQGSVGRVTVQRLTVAATTRRGRGRLTQATLTVPNATVAGSGTFGLRGNDPLGLVFQATTPDVAALATTLTGKTFDAAGALDTTLHVTGTRARPVLSDDFILRDARYGRFAIARATGRVRVDERTATLQRAEIDLQHGRVLADATVPIRLMPFAIDSNRLLSGSIVADDVEASNVAALLPSGTAIAGRVDGRIGLQGTARSPRFAGAMTLANGSFSGPQERLPVAGAMATLAFSGTTVSLQNARASVGGGTIAADGQASIPTLRSSREVTAALNLHLRSAQVDMPQYIKGRFDGDVSVTHTPASATFARGTIAVSSARVPLNAFLNAKPSNEPKAALPDVGFDLRVLIDRDVRVISPNVDVGAQGSIRVMGSLAAPKLAGTVESTGGTVSFLRQFRIERASVAFDPSSGIVPDVDATATTYVSNPSTDVKLHVTGPATNMNIAFTSNPAYDREQILGLLVNAQSLGAVRGVASTGGAPFSATSTVTNLAAGQLNAVFTRNLLEPLSVALGSGLGLQNFQITNDVQGGLGINAVKAFGNYMSFVFAQSFNEPRRVSWSLQAHPNPALALSLSVYSTQNAQILALQPLPLTQTLNGTNLATIPLDSGSNGISFRLERKFP